VKELECWSNGVVKKGSRIRGFKDSREENYELGKIDTDLHR